MVRHVGPRPCERKASMKAFDSFLVRQRKRIDKTVTGAESHARDRRGSDSDPIVLIKRGFTSGGQSALHPFTQADLNADDPWD